MSIRNRVAVLLVAGTVALSVGGCDYGRGDAPSFDEERVELSVIPTYQGGIGVTFGGGIGVEIAPGLVVGPNGVEPGFGF